MTHMGQTEEGDQVRDLGERVATIRLGGPGLRAPSTLLISGVFVMMILAVGAYGLQRGYYGYSRFGLVAAAAWVTPWLAASAVLIIPLGAWLLYRGMSRSSVLSIHRQGLQARFGRGKEYSITWPSLAGIKYEGVQTFMLFLPQPTVYRLAILPTHGPRLDFEDRFGRLNLLVEEIKKSYYPVKLPVYRQAVNSGRPVAFGPLQLESGGVNLGDDRIPWSEIEGVDVERGNLIFRIKSRKAARLRAFDVPDLELLLALIEEKTA
ncbi:MAG TPA: DUF6585 family protein [Anaerolineales bacterium]|nr:DUF6585 family protein [Anaerolineales bacterium]